jgi:uncharacterized membrane protein YkvA (DUF1232 family)
VTVTRSKTSARNASRSASRGASRNADRGASRNAANDDYEASREPRTGTKKTVTSYLAQLPRFLGLLWGLIRDSRVDMWDKILVGGAIAYIISPIDFIPDFIPFLGEVDDLFVLVMAIRRLIENASRSVVLSHWSGDPAELRDFNLEKILVAAAFFLPRRVRRRLRTLGR